MKSRFEKGSSSIHFIALCDELIQYSLLTSPNIKENGLVIWATLTSGYKNLFTLSIQMNVKLE